MAMATYPHIAIREDGVPLLEGTRMKVIQIALDHVALHLSPEEIQQAYPQCNLSLGQIHAALAYYHDHKAEMDRYVEETDRLVAQMKAEQGETPGRKKLRALGLIP